MGKFPYGIFQDFTIHAAFYDSEFPGSSIEDDRARGHVNPQIDALSEFLVERSLGGRRLHAGSDI